MYNDLFTKEIVCNFNNRANRKQPYLTVPLKIDTQRNKNRHSQMHMFTQISVHWCTHRTTIHISKKKENRYTYERMNKQRDHSIHKHRLWCIRPLNGTCFQYSLTYFDCTLKGKIQKR